MTSQNSVEEMRRLLAVRLQQWRMREEQPQSRPGPVITITREAGCGGESIAGRLCSELGLHLYSWELVEQIAKDADVSTQLVASLDERGGSELRDWLAELRGDRSFSSQAYVEGLKRVLFAIAAHGSAVIVGRGSNFFLPQDNRIGLCLVAPLELRIKNTMKELGVSEESARKRVTELDAEHRRTAKKYFGVDLRDSTHYHLVLNTALVEPETIVQIVKMLIAAKT